MPREKAPAYQRYPKQIMGDDKVLLMDWDAYGMHNWLLDISWQQDPRGTIPDDTTVLRRWLRNPDEETWRRVWSQLKTVWPVLEGSRRGNAGMIRCAEKQANYSKGNSGKEQFLNGTQIGTQIKQGLSRKSTEDEEEVKEVGFVVELTKPPDELPPKFQLPAWVPEKAWFAFLEMRKAIRKSPTDRAKELLIRKLEKLMNEGNNPEEVLYQSVVNNWQDVFKLRDSDGKNNASRTQSAGQARTERTRNILSEVLRERHGDSAMDGSDMPGDTDGNHVGGTRPLLVRGAKGISSDGD